MTGEAAPVEMRFRVEAFIGDQPVTVRVVDDETVAFNHGAQRLYAPRAGCAARLRTLADAIDRVDELDARDRLPGRVADEPGVNRRTSTLGAWGET